MNFINLLLQQDEEDHNKKIITAEYTKKSHKFWKLFLAQYKPEKPVRIHRTNERSYKIQD